MFKEDGFATYVSFFFLLSLSLLSFVIFLLRYKTTNEIVMHSFWMIAAIGFLFLAFDEKLMWHERFDLFLHSYFEVEETAITDRLDDIIIGFYGLIGVGVIYIFRREIFQFAPANLLLISGFYLLFISVFLDILVNRYDILPALLGEKSFVKKLHMICHVLEDIIKLLAEGFFISAFYYFFHLFWLKNKKDSNRNFL
jgi:hypothetical protein